MQEPQFGVLQRVDLRLLWPSEASHFTSWLANNLHLLGDALGIDLELRQQEAPVGPFSLDILAHDVGRDRPVVIENQLAPTDHDHLGKLLTYAAGHDASVAVWIAPTFREEHRQALDWLNQRSDMSTEFFGVVVEALQIDDSRPACNFRLVAFPNDWRKANSGGGGTKPSVRGEAYAKFFQNLIDRLRTEYRFTNARKAQPYGWFTFSSGIRGIVYAVAFAQGRRVRTEVYIDRQDKIWNKWLFDALHAKRASIEERIGESLTWERLDSRRASRIAVYRAGSIDDPSETTEAIENWAIVELLKFKEVFGAEIPEILESQAMSPSLDGDVDTI